MIRGGAHGTQAATGDLPQQHRFICRLEAAAFGRGVDLESPDETGAAAVGRPSLLAYHAHLLGSSDAAPNDPTLRPQVLDHFPCRARLSSALRSRGRHRALPGRGHKTTPAASRPPRNRALEDIRVLVRVAIKKYLTMQAHQKRPWAVFIAVNSFSATQVGEVALSSRGQTRLMLPGILEKTK